MRLTKLRTQPNSPNLVLETAKLTMAPIGGVLVLAMFWPLFQDVIFLKTFLSYLAIFGVSALVLKKIQIQWKYASRLILAVYTGLAFLFPKIAMAQVQVASSSACSGGGLLQPVYQYISTVFAGVVLGTAGNLSDNFCQIFGYALIAVAIAFFVAAGFAINRINSGEGYGAALNPFIYLLIFAAFVAIMIAIFFGNGAAA